MTVNRLQVVVVLGVVLMALAMFWAAEKVESAIGG